VILTVQQVTGSIPSNVVFLCLLRIASISLSSLVRSRAFMVLCMRIGERKSTRRRRRRRSSAAAAAVGLCGILRGAGRRCLVQVSSEVATRSHGRNRSAVKLLLLNAVSSVRCVVFLLFLFFSYLLHGTDF